MIDPHAVLRSKYTDFSEKQSERGEFPALRTWIERIVEVYGNSTSPGKDDLLVRQYSTGMLGYYAGANLSKWTEMGRGVDMNWAVIA